MNIKELKEVAIKDFDKSWTELKKQFAENGVYNNDEITFPYLEETARQRIEMAWDIAIMLETELMTREELQKMFKQDVNK